MAAIPDFKRMLREDFRDVPGEWVEKLIYPLNSFNEQVTSAMNQNLNVGTNVVGDLHYSHFTTSPNYIRNKSFTQFTIPWTFRKKPQAVIIGQLINLSTDAPITNPVSLDWKLTGPGEITIRFIVGLKNSTKYGMTTLIL